MSQSLTVTSNECVDNSSNIYLCPGKTICTNNYFNCERFNLACQSNSDGKYFTCSASSTTCVLDVTTDCCPALADLTPQYYCPHTQACVTDKSTCCSLDPATPIYCKAQSNCVAHQYECCEDLKNNGQQLMKCSSENKCVTR